MEIIGWGILWIIALAVLYFFGIRIYKISKLFDLYIKRRTLEEGYRIIEIQALELWTAVKEDM